MKSLDMLKKELHLTPIHIMLLANTGSMTDLLTALFGRIGITTRHQELVDAKEDTARLLEVEPGEPLNHRIVSLTAKGREIVKATSYAPLSRLEEDFKDDIMKKDQPIGRILKKHRMETRREIIGYNWVEEGKKTLLIRNYNIIHKGKPLININEVFSMDIVP